MVQLVFPQVLVKGLVIYADKHHLLDGPNDAVFLLVDNGGLCQHRLQENSLLPNRTSVSIPIIITLLEFCLKIHASSYRVSILNRSMVQPRGSPIRPFIANLFMGEFEVKAICSAPTLHLWFRNVDDTFVIQQTEHSHLLFKHINSQDPHIQFIMEDPGEDGALPFLDTLVSLRPNSTLVTSVCRKPIHMEQYLHWYSNHFFSQI